MIIRQHFWVNMKGTRFTVVLFSILYYLQYVIYVTAERVPLGSTKESQEICFEHKDYQVSRSIASETIKRVQENRHENTLLELIEQYYNNSKAGIETEVSWKYIYSLVPYALPGAIFFGFTCIALPIATGYLCCCGNQCAFQPKNQLERKHQVNALIAYLFFTLMVFGIAVGGVVKIDLAWEGTIDSVCSLENTTFNWQEFVTGFSDPVQSLTNDALHAIVKIESFSNISNVVLPPDLQSTIIDLQELRAFVSKEMETVDTDLASPPLAIKETKKRIPLIEIDLNDELTKIVQAFRKAQNTIEDQLNGKKKEIETSSKNIENTISATNATIEESVQPTVANVKDTFSSTDQYIALTAFLFFCICFFVTAFNLIVFIAGITETCKNKYRQHTFNTGIFFTYLFMVFMFLMAGIILPVTIAANDMCGVIVDIPYNLDMWLSLIDSTNPTNGEISKTLGGCFVEPSIPLLSSYVDALDFEKLYDEFLEEYGNRTVLNSTLTLRNFWEYHKAVEESNVNLTTLIDYELDMINGEADPNITRDGCVTSDGCNQACVIDAGNCDVPEHLEDRRNNLVEVLHAERVYDATSDHIKDVLNSTTETISHVESNLRAVESFILNAIEISGPLITSLYNLNRASECEFIKTDYFILYSNACEHTLGAVATLSVTCLCLGFLGVPLLFTAAFVGGRVIYYEPQYNDSCKAGDDTTTSKDVEGDHSSDDVNNKSETFDNPESSATIGVGAADGEGTEGSSTPVAEGVTKEGGVDVVGGENSLPQTIASPVVAGVTKEGSADVVGGENSLPQTIATPVVAGVTKEGSADVVGGENSLPQTIASPVVAGVTKERSVDVVDGEITTDSRETKENIVDHAMALV